MDSSGTGVNQKINTFLQILLDDSIDDHHIDLDRSIVTKNDDTILYLIFKKEEFSEAQVFEMLEIFLKLQMDPNMRNNKGQTPIHLAIDKEYKSAINILLEYGADINLRDEYGNTIVHDLIENQWSNFQRIPCSVEIDSIDKLSLCVEKIADFVDWLVTKGLIIDCKNNLRMTPLALAIQLRFYWILPSLLKHVNDVTYMSRNNENLLHLFLAKLSYSYEWIRELVRFGKISLPNSKIYTLKPYFKPTVKMLIAKGALVDACEDEGYYTPIHIAALKRNREAIELMLPSFTKVDARDVGNTVLHIISRRYCQDEGQYSEVVRTLISKGSKIDSENNMGYTPLQIAVIYKHLPILKVMKVCGADFGVIHKSFANLLHIFASNASFSTIQSISEELTDFLIKEGCHVNARNPQGTTALHLACQSKNVALVRVLLDYGADVHARELSEHRYTPLHVAANYSDEEVNRLLIEAGADVNAKSAFDQMPLQLALTRGHGLDVLLKSGAFVYVRDEVGTLPIQDALENGSLKNILKVLEFGANINNPDIVWDINNLVYNKSSVSRVIQEHWCKLKCVGLPVINQFVNITYYSRDLFDELQRDCLEEVEMLKSHLIDGRVSCYDFLHMSWNRRCFYVQREEVHTFFESEQLEQTFPRYFVVLNAEYHRSIARKPWLEPARCAWFLLTNICLTIVCVDMIIRHLDNWDLKVLIEAEKKVSYRRPRILAYK